MLSGGSLPAVETGTMDTRRWSEAGRSAPSPCRPPCAHTQRARRPGYREALCSAAGVRGLPE